jgi:hypothetical protein
MPANVLLVEITGYGLSDVEDGKSNFPITCFPYDFKTNLDTMAAGI